jgi:DNA polymerase IV
MWGPKTTDHGRVSPTWAGRRIILHADMDAFYAAVEQRDRPELRGRPVVVGGVGRRGVVSTASYEARPYGVHSAMPTAQARKLCPSAVFLPPDFARYKEASDRVMEVFDSFSPLVEPLSLDEAFLDMTGAEGLFGLPEEMARKIKDAVREATSGLGVSVGAAPCKFVAKVASDFKKPDGLTVVPPVEVAAFLAPLPVSRLWGAGPKTVPLFERLGLRTLRDVAAAPELLLVRHFGETGRRFKLLAQGEDARAVDPDREAKSIGAERTLDEDVTGEQGVKPHLRSAAARVARSLRQENLLAGGVRVKLKTSSFRLFTRQATLPFPTDSEKELYSAACALLGEFDLETPMRLVGLAAFRIESAMPQPTLFGEGERERVRRLDRTLDSLRDRFGRRSIRWGSEPGEE